MSGFRKSSGGPGQSPGAWLRRSLPAGPRMRPGRPRKIPWTRWVSTRSGRRRRRNKSYGGRNLSLQSLVRCQVRGPIQRDVFAELDSLACFVGDHGLRFEVRIPYIPDQSEKWRRRMEGIDHAVDALLENGW